MIDEALESGYIQADETPIAVLDGEKKGSMHRGYYWLYHAPLQRLVFTDYQRGRSRDALKQVLARYPGAMKSDGYGAYEKSTDMRLYGCWAHARRYFFDARSNAPELAEEALQRIGALYEIERMLREGAAAPQERRRVRQEQAVPLLARLKQWLEANPGLPKST